MIGDAYFRLHSLRFGPIIRIIGGAVMADTAKGVLELLEQLRQERDELNALIQGLEKRVGVVQQSDEKNASLIAPRITISVDAIPVGFFHNLSQTEAAEKLLRLNDRTPLKTKEILDAFRKSGLQVHPKSASTILYTALSRNPKFERVSGKAWGLTEWYPGRKRRKDSQEIESGENERG